VADSETRFQGRRLVDRQALGAAAEAAASQLLDECFSRSGLG
jgi:hypothetical protein